MEYILIISSLLLSALFSGTEIAFLSANKLRVKLEKDKGSKAAQIVSSFFENPSKFIGILLIGNNIALVIFSEHLSSIIENQWLSGMRLSGVALLLLNTLIITLIVLVFGEFLPKSIFRIYADKILLVLAYPLKYIQYLLALPAWIMTKSSNFIIHNIFKVKLEKNQEVFTRLDLENFIKSSSTDDDDEIDTELFEKALHLREVRVKECMIPRPEIKGLEDSSTIEELIALFNEAKHSRIIVYEDDIDNVVGYVHHQQLLQKKKSIKAMSRDIPFVPESMRVRSLMNQFIKEGVSIACVVDEYGGTAGIITLEDILEEIFGEIEDEHDNSKYKMEIINDQEYLFSGRLELDAIMEKFPKIQFPDGDYHTLSGYLVMTLENIPSLKEEVELNNYKFIIEKVSDTKIEEVRLLIHSDEEKD